MKHTLRLTLSLAAGALTAAVAVRAAPAAVTVQARQDAVLPDSPHTALFVRVCADCHDLERTVSRRRTRAEWAGTLDQMIEDGADATEEEMAAILDFLVSNFGAVAINSARAEDLTKVLGISSRDAEAIVAHRSANGSFANFEAVQKVPQIDVATLERRKASIRF